MHVSLCEAIDNAIMRQPSETNCARPIKSAIKDTNDLARPLMSNRARDLLQITPTKTPIVPSPLADVLAQCAFHAYVRSQRLPSRGRLRPASRSSHAITKCPFQSAFFARHGRGSLRDAQPRLPVYFFFGLSVCLPAACPSVALSLPPSPLRS